MKLASALALATALGWPLVAHADVEVESESVYRSYETPGLEQGDLVLQPFSQAFRLMAAQRSESGLTSASFETFFRGVGESTPQGPGPDQTSRVYYAYLDLGYGRRNPFDLRLGRQPLTAGGDLIDFDGARLRYRGPLHLGFEIYGGATVSGLGAVVPLGLEDGGPTMAGGRVGGAQLFLTGIRDTQARLGFREIVRGGGIDREDVLADVAHRLGRVRLYGNGEFSTALGVLEEAEAGASIYSGNATYVDVEGFHYTPTFGAESIFNVFDVRPYDEGRLRVRSSVAGGRVGLWARYGHAIFEGGQGSDNFSFGSTFALSPHASLSARAYLAGGYQGSRNGGSADVRLGVLNDRLGLIGGATAAQATNVILPTGNGTFLSVLGGISWTVPDRADLSLLAEEYTDKFSSGSPRLDASFRFKFGAGTARRMALAGERREVRP